MPDPKDKSADKPTDKPTDKPSEKLPLISEPDGETEAAAPTASQSRSEPGQPVPASSTPAPSTPAPPSPDPMQAFTDAFIRATRQVQAGPSPALHKTEDLDKTVRGGKFLVDNRLVNAYGREIDEEGNLLHPEEQQQDMYGRLA